MYSERRVENELACGNTFFTFHSLDYLTDNLTNIQMLVMNNSNFALNERQTTTKLQYRPFCLGHENIVSVARKTVSRLMTEGYKFVGLFSTKT